MNTQKSIFLPALLLALAGLGALAMTTYQSVLERELLAQRVAGSDAQVNEARRVRAALDSLASATKALAQDGNPNARALVDELQHRGVTIDASKAAPAAPASAR